MFKRKLVLLLVIACFSLFISFNISKAEIVYSSIIDYKIIEVESLTRYKEDRIAFQHISLPGSTSSVRDNSISSLLIIKDNQIYLFRDGYDDADKIKSESYVQEIRRMLPKDFWINKINSKPDYLRISDRRTEKLLNVTEEYVEKNYGNFYRSIRNSFINKHVDVFRQLIRERIESGMHLVRKPISPPAFQEIKEPAKYSTSVTAKTINETIYYAEDKDGDDITETFYVVYDDGFNWGFKSGPNILFIYNNKEEDVKQLIGQLCHEAYYGTSEEEQQILKTFPKESDIIEAFNLEKVSVKAGQSSKPKKGAK